MRKKWAQLDINYDCNNRCVFCYAGGNLEKRAPSKTMTEIDKIANSIKNKADGVRILGGEVTLRSDFFEVLSLFKKKDFSMIEIISNGRYFARPGFAKEAVDSGMTGIIISVHGHKSKIHDSLTRVPGSFEELIIGLKELIRLNRSGKLPKLNINLVITRQNYRYLASMLKFFVELGVPSIIFSSLKILGRGFENKKKLIVSYTEMLPYLETMFAQVEKLKKQSKNFYFELENIPFCVLPQKYWPYLANLHGFSDVKYFPRFGYELRVAKKPNEKRNLGNQQINPTCRKCDYLYACPILDCVSGEFFDYLKKITKVNYHKLNLNYYDIYGTKEFKTLKKNGKKI